MQRTYWISDSEGQHLLRNDNKWVPIFALAEHEKALLTFTHHGLACDMVRGLMLAGYFVRTATRDDVTAALQAAAAGEMLAALQAAPSPLQEDARGAYYQWYHAARTNALAQAGGKETRT